MNAFIYRGGATRPNTHLSEILPSARTYVEQCIRRNYAGRVEGILDFRFVFLVPAQYSTLNREQLEQGAGRAGFGRRPGYNDPVEFMTKNTAAMETCVSSLRRCGHAVEIDNNGQVSISDAEGQFGTVSFAASVMQSTGATGDAVLRGALGIQCAQRPSLPYPGAPQQR
ncbi:hypothetical protein BJX62DRAFT_234171 [Aspergillus germanicus]